MMSDKGLLELAAKSIGCTLYNPPEDDDYDDGIFTLLDEEGRVIYGWNPTANKTEAADLSEKLRMTIDFYFQQVTLEFSSDYATWGTEPDDCKTWMEAVTHLAAEIGRGMK